MIVSVVIVVMELAAELIGFGIGAEADRLRLPHKIAMAAVKVTTMTGKSLRRKDRWGW